MHMTVLQLLAIIIKRTDKKYKHTSINEWILI